MIEFTDEHLNAFESARVTDLAKSVWQVLKAELPAHALRIADNDEAGIAFIKRALMRAKKYLVGMKEDRDYNFWRARYATIAFYLGHAHFDMHPWTQKLLTETLWHPYQRIDVLWGIAEISENNPTNQAFFNQLEELTR